MKLRLIKRHYLKAVQNELGDKYLKNYQPFFIPKADGEQYKKTGMFVEEVPPIESNVKVDRESSDADHADKNANFTNIPRPDLLIEKPADRSISDYDIFALCFSPKGKEHYNDNFKLFKESVERNTNANLIAKHVDPSEMIDEGGTHFYQSNELKTRIWGEYAQTITKPTVFVDIDTVVQADLAGGFQGDLTMTCRLNGTPDEKRWLNTGVVFAQPTAEVKKVFKLWAEQAAYYISRPKELKRAVEHHIGINQASFITLMENDLCKDINLRFIPCRDWNATPPVWQSIDMAAPKVVHVAGSNKDPKGGNKPEYKKGMDYYNEKFFDYVTNREEAVDIPEPIISVTTIPDRMKEMRPCLDSLMKQGYPVHIYLPKKSKRTGKRTSYVHKFIVDSGAEIHWLADDLGPGSKLIPALRDGHETVITADDDRIYGDDWAKNLYEAAKRHPDGVVAWRGRTLDDPTNYKKCRLIESDKDERADIITGVDGVVYQKRFFDDEFVENYSFSGEEDDPASGDDLMFSSHLRNLGIPMWVASGKPDIKPTRADKIKSLGKTNGKKELNSIFMQKLFEV